MTKLVVSFVLSASILGNRFLFRLLSALHFRGLFAPMRMAF